MNVTDTSLAIISAEQLRTIVLDAVRTVLAEHPPAQPPAVRTDDWLSTPDGMRRYGMGRAAWLKLIKEGRLPAAVRVTQGGHHGYAVRASDAERVLGPQTH